MTLPALRPAIVSAGSVVFLFCATAFGVVLTLGGLRYATVETEIYLLTTNLLDLEGAAALSLLQLVVVAGLLALAQRLRATPAAARRVVARPRAVRPSDAPLLVVTAVVLLGVATPVATLVVGSLRTPDGWGLRNYAALASTGSGPGGSGALAVPVTEALVVSLRTAVDATWMAMLLGLLVAVVVTRRSADAPSGRCAPASTASSCFPSGSRR